MNRIPDRKSSFPVHRRPSTTSSIGSTGRDPSLTFFTAQIQRLRHLWEETSPRFRSSSAKVWLHFFDWKELCWGHLEKSPNKQNPNKKSPNKKSNNEISPNRKSPKLKNPKLRRLKGLSDCRTFLVRTL